MLVVRFQGGFANQLFQYAFYLKLAEDYPATDVVADLSHYKTCKDHGGFKLKRFVKLKTNNKSNLKGSVSVNENNFDDFLNNHSENENYYFNGYWQEERFFPKNLSRIKNIFVQDKLSSKNRGYIKGIIDSESVSVHVRRGDYVNNFMHGNIANQCYIQNSILFIKDKIQQPHFFVFSDDIEWCKKNLDFEESSVTFVEGNSDNIEQDIILMSNCKHNIISNSSFSWWAQNLNANPQKIVVTPEYWFNQKMETANGLLVENSVKIPNTPRVEQKSDSPFFSILIPVYNTEMTLRRTLSSVLNQTFKDFEVIVVDDGSTDSSYKILSAYSERDKRIHLIRHECNRGLLSTRITAMSRANGKYVLFLDSDDWYELDACQILYDELKKNPVDMLEFGYIREPFKDKEPIIKNYNNRLKSILIGEYYHTFWNKVYKMDIARNVLRCIKDFRATFAEDAFFSIVFSYFAKTIGYSNNYLHHYMISTGISTQKNYSEEKIQAIINDLQSVEANLRIFFAENANEYLDNLPVFMQARYNNLSCLTLSLDLEYNLNLLAIIDKKLGTTLYTDKLKEIEEKIYLMDCYCKSPLLGRTKMFIKYNLSAISYVLKDVLKKYFVG